MELADVLDSKSNVGDNVPVRVRPRAPNKKDTYFICILFCCAEFGGFVRNAEEIP